MQSPPFPRYLVPPRSKYSPQHHVLKHPQLPFLPQCQRPAGRGVDHPPSSSAEVKERVDLHLYSPSGPSWPGLGWPLPLPSLVAVLTIASLRNGIHYLLTHFLTYLLTYLLTPWCRVLLEKLTGLQLVKKFSAFHNTLQIIILSLISLQDALCASSLRRRADVELKCVGEVPQQPY